MEDKPLPGGHPVRLHPPTHPHLHPQHAPPCRATPAVFSPLTLSLSLSLTNQSWEAEVTRDPSLFGEIKDVPWDELPAALEGYVERVEARRATTNPPWPFHACVRGLTAW